MFHVGTNDIDRMMRHNADIDRQYQRTGQSLRTKITVSQIAQSYKQLIHITRQRNSNCKILCSAILPRLKDYQQSEPLIKEFNSMIQQYCCKTKSVIFLPSYKWLCYYGKPVAGYYAVRDGLHLSDAGTARLMQSFQQALSDVNLARELHWRRKPASTSTAPQRSSPTWRVGST